LRGRRRKRRLRRRKLPRQRLSGQLRPILRRSALLGPFLGRLLRQLRRRGLRLRHRLRQIRGGRLGKRLSQGQGSIFRGGVREEGLAVFQGRLDQVPGPDIGGKAGGQGQGGFLVLFPPAFIVVAAKVFAAIFIGLVIA
jgi:hypothetical protein